MTIPDRIPCPDCDGYGWYVNDHGSGETATCDDCGGTGTLPNPTICLQRVTAAIIAAGVPATLYQSGGGCATIGVGNLSHSPHFDDYMDFPYGVGPGFYWDGGTAHRDELGSGPQDWGDNDPLYATYCTNIGDDETAEAYGARVADAYRRYCDLHPDRIGPNVDCAICGRTVNAWEESPDGGRWCNTCNRVCETCDGTAAPNTRDTCPDCTGTGTYTEYPVTAEPCQSCNGTGKQDDANPLCMDCYGSGHPLPAHPAT